MRVDVVPIEPGAVLQHVGQGAAMVAQPPREGSRRVELDGLQVTARQSESVETRDVSLVLSASPSECAGSVDTASTRRPVRASAAA